MDNDKIKKGIQIFGAIIAIVAVASFVWLLASGNAKRVLGPGEDKHWTQPTEQH